MSGPETPKRKATGTNLLFIDERMSRRAALVQLVGLALAGSGLAEFATACDSQSHAKGSTPTVRAMGRVLYIYRGHAAPVFAVAWSPDGKRIASGSADQTAQVWDASNGEDVYTYGGHTAVVITLAWSPDGKWIASGSGDYTVQVWQAVKSAG